MSAEKPVLLSIVENGGYPVMTETYESLGYRVVEATNQRKAIKLFKAEKPEIVVSEFIFQPDFRDRYCNIATLTSQFPLVRPDVKLVLFYEEEDVPALERFQVDYQTRYAAALLHPVSKEQVKETIAALRS